MLTIKGIENLKIDYLSENDLSAFFTLLSIPEIQTFIPDRFDNEDELSRCLLWLISNYHLENFIRLTYKITFMDLLIGWVSIGPLPFNESKYEIAYALHPDYWNKGWMTQIVDQFISYLHREKHIMELYAEVNIKNIASIKILEKNTFIKVEKYYNKDHKEHKYIYFKDLKAIPLLSQETR